MILHNFSLFLFASLAELPSKMVYSQKKDCFTGKTESNSDASHEKGPFTLKGNVKVLNATY